MLLVNMKNKKILVIEDEYGIREMLSDVLTSAGFDVVTSADGKEGVRKIYEEYPDLVLVDCVMPELSGYEVVELIRKEPVFVNLPMIMLTVKSSDADQLKGIRLGVDDYIIKPFNSAVLIAKMKTLLSRKEISINTNPLTQLPGNVLIYREVQERLSNNIPFALLYLDIANFKSYNDYYGFQKGDEIIRHVANILISAVKLDGESGDFVGHIGGDDFVVIATIEKYKKIAEKTIAEFDSTINSFYNQKDRENGYIISTNRQGEVQKFPIMTISVACVSTVRTKITHYGQIGEIAAELKRYAKQFKKSMFVEEQRNRTEEG